MGYRLSYRDFTRYLVRWQPGRATTTLTARDEAAQEAAAYFYRRFVKCAGSPPPATALLPRSKECDPAEYNDADHWDSVFRSIVNRRTVHGPGSGWSDGPEGSIDPPCPSAAETSELPVRELADRLLDAILNDFDTTISYGPEIQQAMVHAVRDLAAGSPASFEDEVNERLAELLPDAMDAGTNGRKRRSRAVARAARFLQGRAAQLAGAGEGEGEGEPEG